MCTVNNNRYTIVLGNNDVDKQSEVKYIHITKPVTKIVVNNNKDKINNTEQLTSSQQNKLNQLIKRHGDISKHPHYHTCINARHPSY